MKLFWSIVIALIVGGLIGYYMAPRSASEIVSNKSSGGDFDKRLELYSDMRKLWADHVFWTRDYIISAVDNLPSAGEDAKRLMKNQEDIGNEIKEYYGADAGSKMTKLLKDHISIAVDIISAAKAKNQTKFEEANKRWQDNANQIADFLSQANSNWSKSDLEDLMSMHLKTTAEELNARLGKNYSKDVESFDAVFDHVMRMADIFSAGIIKQFPDKY